MKKILNEWNNFLKEFKMDDKYKDTNVVNKAQVQAEIQKMIDQNSNLHVSGRPIDPQLLNKTLKENRIKDYLENETDIKDLVKVFDGLKDLDVSRDTMVNMDKMLRPIAKARGGSMEALLARSTWPDTMDNHDKELWMNSILDYNFEEAIANIRHNVDIVYKFAPLYEKSLYHKIIVSIILFTGSSVAVTRQPEKFDPMKANLVLGGGGQFNTSGARNPANKNKLKLETLNQHYKRMYSIFRHFNRYFSDETWTNNMKDSADSLKHPMYADLKKFVNFMASEVYRKINFIKYISDYKPPAKKDYQDANTILTHLARIPVTDEFRVFRGIAVPKQVIRNMQTTLQNPEDRHILEFDFHEISSWSIDLDVAEEFARSSNIDNYDEEGAVIMFSLRPPRRGTYLGEYSVYPTEEEFVTGGKVLVRNIEEYFGAYILECVQD